MSSTKLLQNVPLFGGLSESDLAPLAACLGRRTYCKGAFVFHKDSPGQMLYIIESGKIRIFLPSPAGEEITVNVYVAGEVFGELGFLDGRPRSASAMALEQTTTSTLARVDLLDQIESQPRLARNIIEVLAARLRYTTIYAESLAFLDVNGRVAARLLEMADRFGVPGPRGEELDLHLTQAELATWVAASREKVNKVLAAFREQGLITVQGSTIVILDRHRLAGLITY